MKEIIPIKDSERYIVRSKSIKEIVEHGFYNFKLTLRTPKRFFADGEYLILGIYYPGIKYGGYLVPNKNSWIYKKDTKINTESLVYSAIETFKNISDYSNNEIIHEVKFLPNVGKNWIKLVSGILISEDYKIYKNRLEKIYKPKS